MNPQRSEGAVLVLLLAVSAVAAMLIVGTCCAVSGRYYRLRNDEQIHADAWTLESEAPEEGQEAQIEAFFV